MPLGKSSLRQQWDISTHLLEWSKPRLLITPNVVKDVENRKHCRCEWKNGTATLEDSLAISWKTKILLLMIQQSRTLVQRVENFCPYKILHRNVYSRLIHNSKVWNPSRCPSEGQWINKL